MRHAFLITVWLLWFVSHGSRISISPVLPLIEDELGISHAQAGRLVVFLAIGYCGALLSIPLWSRLWGYRRTLQAALITLTLALFWVRWAPGVAGLSAAMLVIGLTTGVLLPSALLLLTAVYGKEHWGRSIGVFDSAAPAGQFLAPLLAVAVLSAFAWRYVFWAMGAISALVFLLFLWTAPREEPPVDRPRGSIAAVLRNPSLVTLACLWILAAAAGSGLGYLVPVYLVKERGMSLSAANQIFAAGRGFAVLATVFAGILADRFTCRSLLGWSLAASGLSQIGIALWPESVGLGFWVFLEGWVHMMFFPVGLILIARLTASGVRGAAMGFVIGLGAGVGFGVTPWVLGAVADAWSFRVGIAALGGVTVLSSLFSLRIERL